MSRSDERGPFRFLVVLGESTVQGGDWLRKPSDRWADILRDLLESAQEEPLGYHNAGLGASVLTPRSPGYEASAKPSAVERLDDDVIAHRPDLVVVAYGLNDMRAGMDLHAFRSEYEGLLHRLTDALAPTIVVANIYLMTSYRHYPPFDRGSREATLAYNEMLLELAQDHGCLYADIWSAQGERDHTVHLDTVHANRIGNLLIAHEVFKTIVHGSPGMARRMMARDAGTEWTKSCLAIQAQSRERSER